MTDRIGYSKVPIEQKAVLDQELLDAVLSCPALQGLGESECLRLDSGDGISLVFFHDPVAAAEAAIYLHETVAKDAQVGLRIGIHSGIVTRRTDANGKMNVSGPGIEKAQRAMACADGTQIFVTEYFAENLRAFDGWADRLLDLGDQPIKHGEKLALFGLATKTPGKLAIIYRRKAQPDDAVLDLLERRLLEEGFSVFIDRHLTVGVEWARQIELQIRRADAVIVLMSEKAAASEMVLFELQTAIDQQQATGKPHILPVRIGAEGPIDGDVGALLARYQYALWRGPDDDEDLIAALVRALSEPERSTRDPIAPLERVGGAMMPDSPYYIVRPTDAAFTQAVLERDSIVLVKGARQIGKTSLMARSLRAASQAGAGVIWTDMQSFSRSQLETEDTLYLAIAIEMAHQLNLDDDPIESWRPVLGASTNFERFIRTKVLEQVEGPVVWFLDEVDRLFTLPYSGDFFGLIRAWHNRRATRTEESWNRFTVAIGYATEAHLFISDLNQSPFNVGTRLELSDFDVAQVAELNTRYGGPLGTPEEIQRFHALVGGQPYLTRRGLDEIVRNDVPLRELEAKGAHDEGPFGDHLRRLLVALSSDEDLMEEAARVSQGQPPQREESFLRLRAGGVVRGTSRQDATLRCGIYGDYLRKHLT